MADPVGDTLREVLEPPVVVVCVGNPLRGDDGFGPAVAERLGIRPDVIDAGTTPENELPRVANANARTVLFVDAVHFGGVPGELRLIAPGDLRVDDFSTHLGSLDLCATFLEQSCGAKTLVLAAHPATVGFQEEMSAPVKAAVEEAAALLAAVLGS